MNYGLHGPTELELYMAEDCIVENGFLRLRTRWNPTFCKNVSGASCPASKQGAPGARLYNYTSCWVDSKSHVFQQYGRFEVRARLPDPRSYGVWPAHWLMPEPEASTPPNVCWPVGGEIDIMESLGRSKGTRNNGTVFGTYHWAKQCGEDLRSGLNGVYPPVGAPAIDYSADFHTYAIEWNASSIVWFVDNRSYWERHNGDRPDDPAHSAVIMASFRPPIRSWCPSGRISRSSNPPTN